VRASTGSRRLLRTRVSSARAQGRAARERGGRTSSGVVQVADDARDLVSIPASAAVQDALDVVDGVAVVLRRQDLLGRVEALGVPQRRGGWVVVQLVVVRVVGERGGRGRHRHGEGQGAAPSPCSRAVVRAGRHGRRARDEARGGRGGAGSRWMRGWRVCSGCGGCCCGVFERCTGALRAAASVRRRGARRRRRRPNVVVAPPLKPLGDPSTSSGARALVRLFASYASLSDAFACLLLCSHRTAPSATPEGGDPAARSLLSSASCPTLVPHPPRSRPSSFPPTLIMVTNASIIFSEVPHGAPVPGQHLKRVEEELDLATVDLQGGVVLQSKALSWDPYLKGRMRAPSKSSYNQPFALGKVIDTLGVGVVERSDHPDFPKGAILKGLLPFSEYAILSKARLDMKLAKIVEKPDGVSWTTMVGACGSESPGPSSPRSRVLTPCFPSARCDCLDRPVRDRQDQEGRHHLQYVPRSATSRSRGADPSPPQSRRPRALSARSPVSSPSAMGSRCVPLIYMSGSSGGERERRG